MARPELANPSDRDNLRAVFRQTTGTYEDRADILAETAALPENLVLTELETGGRYAVAASGATDHHITTAGGNKLYVRPGHSGEMSVSDFGAVGDGVTDDTSAVETAIAAAETAATKLIFRRGTYLVTSPLTITGIDVDFGGSTLLYKGTVGQFALTLNAVSVGGTTGRVGNRFENLSLKQGNPYVEFETYTGSKVFDPGSLAAYHNITNIVPNADVTTTVTVAGARSGGFVRVEFDQIVDGVVLTGEVTADDEVTVYFSNYDLSSAIDMASGTLSVTVVNNAYHGLNIGGSAGTLENIRVHGFTGVSMAMGNGIEQYTGVTFPANERCYYWSIDALSIIAGAGWGLVIQPRNNENQFGKVTFLGYHFYAESTPYRAPYITALVLGGITNSFEKMAIEAACSEPMILVGETANNQRVAHPVYVEVGGDYVATAVPMILAKKWSSETRIAIRVSAEGELIADEGTGNTLGTVMAAAVNGNLYEPPVGIRSLLTNGDFVNKLVGWSDYSTGSAVSYPGAGHVTGKRVRYDLTAGRLNLLQAVTQETTITASGWFKTDVPGLRLQLGGRGSRMVPYDGQWHFVSMRVRASGSANVQVIHSSNYPTTGYVEISDLTCVTGNTALAAPVVQTEPSGSASYNPPSLADGTRATTTITVQGAAMGDHVIGVSFSQDLQGLRAWGYVSATDTVTVVFENNTGGTIDLGTGTLRARVQKA